MCIRDRLKLSQRQYKQTLILVTHDDMIASQADRIITVSYTHLDVYKRQQVYIVYSRAY